MEWEFADRVGRVEESATLAVSNRAAAREAEGADVVDLSVGEPDFDTPTAVREAGKAAVDAGHTTYTPASGIRALREAVAEDLRRRGLDHGPEEVIVTPGGKQALFETVQTLIEPGDEVVLIDPAWVSYEAMVSLAGGSVVRVDTTPHGFQLAPAMDDLRAVVTDATELIVVNSPNNPTGAVYSERALAGVRDLAVEHDVAVVSDEIYDRVVYDAEQTSLGSLDGMGDRTVTINGFSKSYAMTGWRLGYLAGPEPLVGEAGKVHSHSVTCAANFVQHAGITALEEVDDAVERMVDSFRERRDLVVDLLADHGVDVAAPEGAFYVLVPVAEDDHSWAMDAIDEAGVATVPGVAFNAPGHVRISYAAARDRL
ncbi:aspartate aminotransferase, partial [Halobacteriales archaeon SW_5_70_135]